MAVYRYEAKIISRAKGKCAVASAAYQSDDDLYDERQSMGFTYRHRDEGVMHAEIMAPHYAPAWTADRNALWNAVEKAEDQFNRKTNTAQTARTILVSLPHELTHEQRVELVRNFVREAYVARGMVADFAIHAPHPESDDRNFHAHIQLTMRKIDATGFTVEKGREWNTPAQHSAWRKQWADVQNGHLEKAGRPERVSHLSNEAQGLDREPEPKLGPVATKMEREGRDSHAGDDRRVVQFRNGEVTRLKRDLAAIEAEIIDLAFERTRRKTAMAEPAGKYDKLKPPVERRGWLPADEATTAARPALEAGFYEQAEKQKEALGRFEEQKQREAEDEAKRAARQRTEAEADARTGDIAEARARYGEALGTCYSIRDPYNSLANAAMMEYGSFNRQQQELRQQAASETDADKRRIIELRREIEANEYMAITSTRLASISRVVTGNHRSETAERYETEGKAFTAQAIELRTERRGLMREQVQREAAAKFGWNDEQETAAGAGGFDRSSSRPPAHNMTRAQAEKNQQIADDRRRNLDPNSQTLSEDERRQLDPAKQREPTKERDPTWQEDLQKAREIRAAGRDVARHASRPTGRGSGRGR